MPGNATDKSREKLIAAAYAAASWGRARRMTWSSTPLPKPPTRAPRLGGTERGMQVAAEHRSLQAVPRVQAIQAVPSPLPAREPIWLKVMAAVQARLDGDQVKRWTGRLIAVAGIAALLVALSKYGRPYVSAVWARSTAWISTRATAGTQGAHGGQGPLGSTSRRDERRGGTGSLHVVSTPAGAQVFVDGKDRGVSPLTLTDLTVGSHAVDIKSSEGSVTRTVSIARAATTEVQESIFAGWLAVYSPFDVTVLDGSQSLKLDERGQVMLAPGPHDLKLFNKSLEYEESRHIDLKPGETQSLSVTRPRSTLTITSGDMVEVWLDGVRAGETPLNNVGVDVGAHDIVARRPNGATRRFAVTVTTRPFTLNVDPRSW